MKPTFCFKSWIKHRIENVNFYHYKQSPAAEVINKFKSWFFFQLSTKINGDSNLHYYFLIEIKKPVQTGLIKTTFFFNAGVRPDHERVHALILL